MATDEASRLVLPRYPVPGAGVHPAHLFPDYGSTATRAPGRPLVLLEQALTEVTGPTQGLVTQMVLWALSEERRHTLVAERTDDGYRLDIRPAGDSETVFFAV